jgi:Na+-translocating ferredoxin:NAD+ oxidoreductase subunit G
MRALLPLLMAAALALLANPANARQYWKKSALLADMFPDSERVAPQVLTMDDAAKASFQTRLGYAAPVDSYTFYVATTGETVDGYVLFDDQIGQHEPITFAVQLDATGVILRQEIVVYREKYGAEVQHPRFRGQFVGRSAADGFKPGEDVRIISGATYSSKAMAMGVHRATVLGAMLLQAAD